MENEITTFKPTFEIYEGLTLDQVSEKIHEHTRNGIIEMITIGGYLDTAKQLCLDNNIQYKAWLSDNTNYNVPQGDRLIKAFQAIKKYPLILEQGKSSINQVLLDYEYYENPDSVTKKELKPKRDKKETISGLKLELERLQKKYMAREMQYKEPNDQVQDLTLKLVEKEGEVRELIKELDNIKSKEGVFNVQKIRQDCLIEGQDKVKTAILDWIRYKRLNNVKFTISELIDFVNKIGD